ncbi:hypothetical protein MRX96_003233 [Rhipicephalus microplus]
MDPERDAGMRAARAAALARQHQRDEGAFYVDATRYPGRRNAFAAVAVSATTGKLPTASTVRARTADHVEEAAIALATDFYNDGATNSEELLNGLDQFWRLTTGRTTTRFVGNMGAVETVVGRTFHGPVEESNESSQCTQTEALRTSVIGINSADVLTEFWALASVGLNDFDKTRELNPNQQFVQATIRRVDSCYKVALPSKLFRHHNKKMVMEHVHHLTRRLQYHPDLCQDYDSVIRHYDRLEIAELNSSCATTSLKFSISQVGYREDMAPEKRIPRIFSHEEYPPRSWPQTSSGGTERNGFAKQR